MSRGTGSEGNFGIILLPTLFSDIIIVIAAHAAVVVPGVRTPLRSLLGQQAKKISVHATSWSGSWSGVVLVLVWSGLGLVWFWPGH